MTIHQHPQDTHALATPANSRRSTSPALRIEKLRTRAAPLDMTSDQFRSLGHDTVDRIADFLASVRTHPVTRAESPEQVRAAVSATRALPEEGQDPVSLLRDVPRSSLNTRFSTAIRASMVTSHPAPLLSVCLRTCWQLL